MNHRFTAHLTALAAVALLLFGAGESYAFTRAGETVSNLATLSYEVNGEPQPDLESDGGTPTTFTVDLLVHPQVTRQTGAIVSVTPGQDDRLHTFRVDNLGNNLDATTAQYFRLFIATPTDDLGVTSVLADIDMNGDGDVSDAGDLTGQDISAGVVVQIGTESFILVTLKADVPNTALDGATTVYDLIAMAVSSANAALTASAAPTDGVDIVFSDAQGTYSSEDTDPDGMHSARGTFQSSSASFTIEKTDSVAGGYYIPGAVVTYSIAVVNNGSADATFVTISDSIPANTTYSGNLNCTEGTAKYSTDSGGSYSTTAPNPLSGATNVQCDGATVAAGGGTTTMTFDVTID